MYTLTTLETVPPFAIGYVRDLRVRWALEEAGQPYRVRTVSFEQAAQPPYRREQPFGQVPLLHDGDSVLFESGAILLHLADKHPVLQQDTDRAHTTMWLFAALNSVEPYLANLAMFDLLQANEPWAAQQRPGLEQMALKRLGDLDAWLAGREHLAGGFGVADIMMASVLRLMDSAKLVERFPSLSAYKQRCLSRPAFRKAHADQVSHFSAAMAA